MPAKPDEQTTEIARLRHELESVRQPLLRVALAVEKPADRRQSTTSDRGPTPPLSPPWPVGRPAMVA
ncbi:protein of unknown function (plasmid) [Azospirillum lipoferum 4B]|uniref:Uncharacterized protein n=1 Tax=Azospirillum lipoferum (strain 4B) TaxID=862719 RepID=G7ZIQ5_AZOL4|nr:protein of unknown function [Azospirillum lipoferum 4B]